MKAKRFLALAMSLLMVGVFATTALAASHASKIKVMTIEELKDQLGKEDLVVVDVRTGKDWSGSEKKIPGAVRANAKQPTDAVKAHKDKSLVFYCA